MTAKITAAEWDKTHPDFRGTLADGTRVVLRLNPQTGGTELVPVTVEGR